MGGHFLIVDLVKRTKKKKKLSYRGEEDEEGIKYAIVIKENANKKFFF